MFRVNQNRQNNGSKCVPQHLSAPWDSFRKTTRGQKFIFQTKTIQSITFQLCINLLQKKEDVHVITNWIVTSISMCLTYRTSLGRIRKGGLEYMPTNTAVLWEALQNCWKRLIIIFLIFHFSLQHLIFTLYCGHNILMFSDVSKLITVFTCA